MPSKHKIFFVHGVGDDAGKWSTRIREDFEKLFDSYPRPPGGQPFAAMFETHEVLYNDLFDAWRQRIAQDAGKALKELAAGGLPNETILRLFQAGQAAGGGGFFRTHALDVLQYRFLELIDMPVRVAVDKAIKSELPNNEFGVPVGWSVIAHSLGTSVVHDMLHQVFNPASAEENATLFQPRAVLMLANVSQLLHNPKVLGAGVDAYKSFVRPRARTSDGACRYLLSAANRLDPIAFAGDYDPPADWRAQAGDRFLDLEFTAFPKSRNVHGYAEYLAHPAVHIPLFRTLTDRPDWIGADTERKALEKYAAENPVPDLERLALEKLRQQLNLDDWVARIKAWKEVLDKYTREQQP